MQANGSKTDVVTLFFMDVGHCVSSAKRPRQHVPAALYAKRWNLDKTDHKLPTGCHTKVIRTTQ